MPDIIIAPSILSADFGRLEEEVIAVEEAWADWIHVDVMDGVFVPRISVGDPVMKAVRKATDKTIDAHLMVKNPENHVEAYCDAGADYITVHAEATDHLHRTLQMIKNYKGRDVKAGVAINPGSSFVTIPGRLINSGLVDLVLIMTVNPGYGGQKFLPEALDSVRYFREGFPNLDIQVDGGITGQTAFTAAEVGANVFVAGSSVFTDPEGYEHAISKIRTAAESVLQWRQLP